MEDLTYNKLMLLPSEDLTEGQKTFLTVHNEMVMAGQKAAECLLIVASDMRRMKEEELYKAAGFESFKDYVETALNIKERQAYNWIKRVNCCHDKFCANCQKSMAQERQFKFAPKLDELRKDYEVFHLVLTVPNCGDNLLKSTVNVMYKKFPYLLEFFKGKHKVKSVDFLAYGYGGAVRALEITQNEETKEYHPHFHCMILFKKGLELDKHILNPYSFKNDEDKKIWFSDFEVFLQKLWYLLINGERVTAKAIEELKVGYDVHMSNSAGCYHEVFKYACKGFFDENDMFVYSSKTFWTLYEVLHNRRIIQGYGLLYDFDECEDILADETDRRYEYIEKTLREIEKPTFRIENLDEVINRVGICRYFTKNSVRRFLEGKRAELEAKAMLASEKLDEDFFGEPEQLKIMDEDEKK